MNKQSVLTIRSITAIYWLGFFMAISFMEAPLKFTAPGLSMSEGLAIGKIIFRSLNTCEWTFLLVLYITCVIKKPSPKECYLIAAISIIMLLETCWLLPVLDTQANKIISGNEVINHTTHWLYILMEIIKMPVLLLTGIESSRMLYKEHINSKL